jgi:hypothetical protein
MEEKDNRAAAPRSNPADPEGREIHIQPAPHWSRTQVIAQPQRVSTRPPVAIPTAAPALDPLISIDNLAERIHKATYIYGTDEEQLDLALLQVHGNPTAAKALRAAYLRLYGVTLDEVLADELTPVELAYAMQLLDGSAPALPAVADPYKDVATRLHDALALDTTQAPQIYALLDPMQRDLIRVHALEKAYSALYKADVHAVLKAHFGEGSDEWQYVQHLLAGAAMQANVEQTELSPAQAQALFDDLAKLQFVTDQDTRMPVPFHFPVDGCHLRAHLMSQRLTELGYASEKVFAVSRKDAGLNVNTDLAEDTRPGETPHVHWVFHVAPVIRIAGKGGIADLRVLDPTLGTGPMTVPEWTHKMNPETFKLMNSAAATGILGGNIGEFESPLHPQPRNRKFPNGENFSFVTGRDQIVPEDLMHPNTPESAQKEMDSNRPLLRKYAVAARAHEMAQFIRQELRSTVPSAAKIIQLFKTAGLEERKAFHFGILGVTLGYFGLVIDMISKFSPGEFDQINAALNRP